MGTRAPLSALVALLALSCETAQLVVREPVIQRCQGASLKGCPDLADGVTLYISGDKDGAEKKIRGAVAQNTGDKLKPFAVALRTLGSAPGLGSYASQFNAIADLIDGGAVTSATSTSTSGTNASRPVASDNGAREEGRLATAPPPIMHTKTVVPAKDPDRGPCVPFHESQGATCAAGFMGPMTVTDIDFGSECPDELIVLAVGVGLEPKADVEHPHWYVTNPPRSRLAIHGAAFTVEPTEELVFAARPTSGVTASSGSGCFVTWSSKGVTTASIAGTRLE